MKILVLIAALAAPSLSYGYIPPVREIVESIYDGRKPQSGLEFQISHRVQVPGGQVAEVAERIVVDGNAVQIIWKTQGATVAAQWERQSYVVNSQASLASRSSLFMKYLVGTAPEDFTRQLMNEQFMRREQLVVFNGGYTPKGDPNTWKPKTFYKLHDDIFFSRLNSGAAVAVVGLDEGSLKKTVYFDDDFRGVARLEWKEGAGVTAWDFGGFTKSAGAFYPKRLSFIYQGVERVTSTVASVKVLKAPGLSEFKKSFLAARAGGVNSTAEPVLKLLLSHR